MSALPPACYVVKSLPFLPWAAPPVINKTGGDRSWGPCVEGRVPDSGAPEVKNISRQDLLNVSKAHILYPGPLMDLNTSLH